MDKYNVTVVEWPAKRLVGMKVRTSMQKAQEDCGALWGAFNPRMGAELPNACAGGSYGISVMLSPEAFDYWAAVEMEEGIAIPEGMACIDIPGATYAKCTEANLEKLSDAFMYLYAEWTKTQGKYVCDEAPCIEYYPPNWQPADAVEILAPLKKV